MRTLPSRKTAPRRPRSLVLVGDLGIWHQRRPRAGPHSWQRARAREGAPEGEPVSEQGKRQIWIHDGEGSRSKAEGRAGGGPPSLVGTGVW